MDRAKTSDIIEETFAWLQERKAEMKREEEKWSMQDYGTAVHYRACYDAFRAVEKYLRYQIAVKEGRFKEPGFKHEYEAVWGADENDKIQAEAGGDAEIMEAEMMGGRGQ